MSTTSVVSPVPGTFYRRPDPDSPTYVEVGSEVEAGDVLGLVELMKNFMDVKASEAGTVTEVLADNEDAVTAGQALFTVETS